MFKANEIYSTRNMIGGARIDSRTVAQLQLVKKLGKVFEDISSIPWFYYYWHLACV